MKTIEKFIKENNLMFNSTGSGLNSDCTILSGFADFKGVDDINVLIKIVKTVRPDAKDFENELQRVFDYAYNASYGIWWRGKTAKKLYKF